MNVRNSAKAIILQDGELLTIKCYENEEFFILPGGGQEHNEPLHQTVIRECREEINVDVEVHALLYIREYIGKNHGYIKHAHFHQVDFMFLCNILTGQASIGHIPDTAQTGVAWLDLKEIETFNFYPHSMRTLPFYHETMLSPPQSILYI